MATATATLANPLMREIGPATPRVVEPLIDPSAALIVVVPGAAPVANPVAEMVATEVTLEVHVTSLVISS